MTSNGGTREESLEREVLWIRRTTEVDTRKPADVECVVRQGRMGSMPSSRRRRERITHNRGVSVVKPNGTHDCAPRDISIPSQPMGIEMRKTLVSCGRTPATSTLCFQRLACGSCGHGDVSGCGSLHAGLCSLDLTGSAASALEFHRSKSKHPGRNCYTRFWIAKPFAEKSVACPSKRNYGKCDRRHHTKSEGPDSLFDQTTQ